MGWKLRMLLNKPGGSWDIKEDSNLCTLIHILIMKKKKEGVSMLRIRIAPLYLSLLSSISGDQVRTPELRMSWQDYLLFSTFTGSLLTSLLSSSCPLSLFVSVITRIQDLLVMPYILDSKSPTVCTSGLLTPFYTPSHLLKSFHNWTQDP